MYAHSHPLAHTQVEVVVTGLRKSSSQLPLQIIDPRMGTTELVEAPEAAPEQADPLPATPQVGSSLEVADTCC